MASRPGSSAWRRSRGFHEFLGLWSRDGNLGLPGLELWPETVGRRFRTSKGTVDETRTPTWRFGDRGPGGIAAPLLAVAAAPGAVTVHVCSRRSQLKNVLSTVLIHAEALFSKALSGNRIVNTLRATELCDIGPTLSSAGDCLRRQAQWLSENRILTDL
jgi:hypothetical protein